MNFTKKIISFLLVLVFLSACQGITRRDPVIITQESEVKDFYSLEEGISDLEQEEKEPLLPEYFNPYKSYIKEYRASRGDILEISIFGSETEGGKQVIVDEVIVAPDGKLYYMFVDGFFVEGLVLDEIKQELETHLSKMYVEPQVSVTPKFVQNQNYVILGKVNSPGLYPLNTTVNLRQAIGNAGGISLGGFQGTTINIANLKNSFIIRDGKKLDIDFEELIISEGSNQNIIVNSGDYIYIASSLLEEVFLLGAVREQKPIPYKDGMTVMSILSGSAGTIEGVLDDGKLSQVLIIRGSLEDPRVIRINLYDVLAGRGRDVYVLPGDIVYVPNKYARFGRELVRLAIDAFVTGFTGTAAGHYGNDHVFN